MTETQYKNTFKCDCGNHMVFSALYQCQFGDTFDTTCDFCQKRKTLKYVKSEAV